jgi:hypothetical protein
VRGPRPERIAFAACAWLALFSILFSAGSAFDLWPSPALRGFGAADLAAGFVFSTVLLAALVAGRK